jgi:hypothetical protein
MFAARNIVSRLLKLINYFTQILYYNYENKEVLFP